MTVFYTLFCRGWFSKGKSERVRGKISFVVASNLEWSCRSVLGRICALAARGRWTVGIDASVSHSEVTKVPVEKYRVRNIFILVMVLSHTQHTHCLDPFKTILYRFVGPVNP